MNYEPTQLDIDALRRSAQQLNRRCKDSWGAPPRDALLLIDLAERLEIFMKDSSMPEGYVEIPGANFEPIRVPVAWRDILWKEITNA